MLNRGLILACAWMCCTTASLAHASDFHEATAGDFSNDRLAPTQLLLTMGSNAITGTVVSTDRDFFTVRLPEGTSLASIYLDSYDSLNARAFIGMQAGTTFTVDPDNPDPALLLGYTHFGFDILMGEDLLDDIRSNSPGTPFAIPLPAGDYSFWINQTEPAPTQYSFTLVVVPEPGSLMLLGSLLLLLPRATRRAR